MAAGLADHVWSLQEWLTYPCAQPPYHQAVQIGSTTTINYLPNGWVIIDGNHIHIQAHDGKGNNVTEVATINLVRKEVI
jgi:hypothetical protein